MVGLSVIIDDVVGDELNISRKLLDIVGLGDTRLERLIVPLKTPVDESDGGKLFETVGDTDVAKRVISGDDVIAGVVVRGGVLTVLAILVMVGVVVTACVVTISRAVII